MLTKSLNTGMFILQAFFGQFSANKEGKVFKKMMALFMLTSWWWNSIWVWESQHILTNYMQCSLFKKQKEVHSSVCCCLSVLCILMWSFLELFEREALFLERQTEEPWTVLDRAIFFFSKGIAVILSHLALFGMRFWAVVLHHSSAMLYNCLLSESVLL